MWAFRASHRRTIPSVEAVKAIFLPSVVKFVKLEPLSCTVVTSGEWTKREKRNEDWKHVVVIPLGTYHSESYE